MSDVVLHDIIGEKIMARFELFPIQRTLKLEIRELGDHATAHLHFSNIGEETPIDFFESLNPHYVTSKLLGNAAQTPDLMATIAGLHALTKDPKGDISPADAEEIRAIARRTMIGYDGDDAGACHGIAHDLNRFGIEGAGAFIRDRESDEARRFRDRLWEPLMEMLEPYVQGRVPDPFDTRDDPDIPEP